MELYVLHHGEARPKEEDPNRPLTDTGRSTVERVARRAAELPLRLDTIHHSGVLRARQTAEILADHLGAAEAPGTQGPDATGPGGAHRRVAGWAGG